jgi:ADP-ribose pyrophosphatase YjhB (NUDIX family)
MRDERRYPERPLIGVRAVIFEGDRVVLVRRGQDPGREKFFLDKGELGKY